MFEYLLINNLIFTIN